MFHYYKIWHVWYIHVYNSNEVNSITLRIFWFLSAISSGELVELNKHPSRGCPRMELISTLSRLKQRGLSVLLKDTIYCRYCRYWYWYCRRRAQIVNMQYIFTWTFINTSYCNTQFSASPASFVSVKRTNVEPTGKFKHIKMWHENVYIGIVATTCHTVVAKNVSKSLDHLDKCIGAVINHWTVYRKSQIMYKR